MVLSGLVQIWGYNFSESPDFEDNFDYFDTAKWYKHEGLLSTEYSTYPTVRSPSNVYIENGTMIIKLEYNSTDSLFYGGFVESFREFGYGSYEVRAKLGNTSRNYAFWLFSPKDCSREYKRHSEIDFESEKEESALTSFMNFLPQFLHKYACPTPYFSDLFNHALTNLSELQYPHFITGYIDTIRNVYLLLIHDQYYLVTTYFSDDIFEAPWSGYMKIFYENEINKTRNDFHIYKIEYTPTYIRWYVDDELIREAPGDFTIVVYDIPLTESVEDLTESNTLRIFFGAWHDSKAFNENEFPGYYEIDWVKYYPLIGYVNYTNTIDSLPYHIRKPGIYTIANNMTYINGTGIFVHVSDVVIDGNGNVLEGNISHGNNYGIYSSTQNNITIKNLKLKNWNTGMSFINVDYLKIYNVSIENTIYGIYLKKCNNLILSNISVNSALNDGIRLQYCNNGNLKNIEVDNCQWTGLYLMYSQNINIYDTIGKSNNYATIGLWNSSNNLLYNITGIDNNYNGINLQHNSNNNILKKITSINNRDKILVKDSYNNTIS